MNAAIERCKRDHPARWENAIEGCDRACLACLAETIKDTGAAIENPAQNKGFRIPEVRANGGAKWDNESGPTGASTPAGPDRRINSTAPRSEGYV